MASESDLGTDRMSVVRSRWLACGQGERTLNRMLSGHCSWAGKGN